jgi:predicted transcriptional regulator
VKAVLMSIKPEWCEKILGGEKTVEIRKTRPKLEPPFKCYIYCTLAGSDSLFMDVLNRDVAAWNRGGWPEKRGCVIGEFICDDIRRIGPEYCVVKEDIESAIAGSCLTVPQVKDYAGWKSGMSYADLKDLCGWHISNFKLYKKPVKLKDFWAIQPCTHRGDGCTCRRWDAEKLICRGEAFGIERPPQSWCYVEEFHA